MARATQAIIDLHALRENYQLAKQCAANSRAFAVIKANAYGHGMLTIANALSLDADGFAVACVDEAVALREAGILLPILVLEGAMDSTECQVAFDLDLELAVHQQEQLDWMTNAKGSIKVWIKVDTGMHRLGFAVQDVPAVVSDLRLKGNVSQVHLMSHFACADDLNHPFNQVQLDQMQTLSPMQLPWSMSNSAALLTMPQSHGALVRPGIMMYGSSPMIGSTGQDFKLQAVMTLQSEVIAMHRLKAGDSVGYGQSFMVDKDTQLAVVAIGYGDGYPRSAKAGTPVLIKGKKCPLVGRVSMDMLTVDVTEANVQLGDTVTLWGTGLSADEVAMHCDTLSYELFCRLTNRVKFQYLGR